MPVEVRRWLQEIGLGQYADLFEQHEIDDEALLALTDAHLKELGIPLGPRAKLLKALERRQPASASSTAAQRRQLTVMFVDLVGSTALSSRLDPEDLRTVIRGYQGVVANAIARYEGYVAQYLGDGVLAYFGFPVAHEDDAERAVRAALASQEAVAGLSAPGGEALATRIGIATGLVVVGDLLGEGAAKEHAVVGETPNLAARLQGLAEPGQVVVSARTRAMLGQLFEFLDLGPRRLKGMATPVAAYAVPRARPLESRFEAQRAGSVPRIVGREDELSRLRERWREASTGNGQCVLLIGEAGIGKSRIVRALHDALGAEPHVRIGYQCSPYHADSALFPVIQQVTRAAGIGPQQGPEEQLDRLEALLGGVGAADPIDVALMAALLGLDGRKRYGPLRMTPRQQRMATFRALFAQVVRVAQQQPVLLVLEDAHWIDPTTLELIDFSIARLADVAALLVVTARPDFEHVFAQHERVTRVTLGRLGRAQIEEIADGVARGKALPPALMEEIVAKTDGVPLFIEEFTKTMLESDLLRETADAFVLEGQLQTLSVPTSLRDSLTARLDRLQPVREVAQTAACIGRDFPYVQLATISPLPEQALRDALAKLVEAELLYHRMTSLGDHYSFKHALVRDAAYESLLKEKRQQIHARLVQALEATPGAPPELIAQHASRAELRHKAIDYWQKAATVAMARPAYKEAIAHLNQALQLVERMGEGEDWQERRLLLLITLGQASIPLRGYGHPETVAAFWRAHELVATMPGAPHRFPIFYAVWVADYVRGKQDAALDTARGMVEEAERDGNPAHMLTALRSLAMSQMITGSPLPALKTFEQAQRLSDAAPPRSREQRIATADRFANDPQIGTQVHLAYTLWGVGRVDEARRLLTEAVEEARALGHAHTLCHVMSYASMLAALSGHIDEAFALSAETGKLARRHEFEMLLGYGSSVHAFVLWLRGEPEASAAEMEAGLARLAHAHAGTTVPVFRAIQARTLAALRRWDEAERRAAEVREQLHAGSERFYWPECWRLLGDYLRLLPGSQSGDIESAYGKALASASAQGAKTWCFCAALCLARYWAEQGAFSNARALLLPLRADLAANSQLLSLREADMLLEAAPG